MKKVLSVLFCCLLVATVATGCGSSAKGSDNDYTAIIMASRPAEYNESDMYQIVAGPLDESTSMDEVTERKYNEIFGPAGGFVEEDMQRYAISLGSTIIQVYGVAIILPAEGKQQAVMDQINAYIEQQKKAQENYLPDQYEIASNAIVKVAPTGEILLAMCPDADVVMQAMESGLKA